MSVAASLCQSVLDALTDVDMPKRHPARTAQGSIEADGIGLPVYGAEAYRLVALRQGILGESRSVAEDASGP
jgi:hypothetical protein